MSDEIIKIRRALVRMTVGDTVDISIPGMSPHAVMTEVRAYARTRRVYVDAKLTADGVSVTRLEALPKVSVYPEIDALKVGEAHHFDLPSALHQRVRQAASNRARTHGVAYTCQRQAGGKGITVTRIPATPEEHASAGALNIKPRTTKWGLERLETERQLRYTLSAEDQMRLRMSATRKAAIMGWRIRCRKQDDGTMLVYRTDVDFAIETVESVPSGVPPNYH